MLHSPDREQTYQRLLLWILVGVIVEVAMFLSGGAYIANLVLVNQATILHNEIVLQQMHAESQVRGLQVLANQDTVKLRLAQLEARR